MAVQTRSVADICASAKEASRVLARLESGTRDAALEAIAVALDARVDEILEANARDVEAAEQGEIGSALIDRLRLTPDRVAAIARGVREIAELRDPVGEVLDGFRLPNGLDVRKVRVPLGVVAVVYESRPNVTIDCTALALKSGNAIVLRGSSMAAHSNAILAELAREAIAGAGVPAEAVALVAGGGREELREAGVELRGDARSRSCADGVADAVVDATEEDWATEYLALILAVKVVDSLDEAIAHVNRYGSGHSEAIVTDSESAARAWVDGIDAAVVYVNAYTRFYDGVDVGMGADSG